MQIIQRMEVKDFGDIFRQKKSLGLQYFLNSCFWATEGHQVGLFQFVVICMTPCLSNFIFLKVGDHVLVLYIHQQIFVNETALNYFECENLLRWALTVSFTSFTLFRFLMYPHDCTTQKSAECFWLKEVQLRSTGILILALQQSKTHDSPRLLLVSMGLHILTDFLATNVLLSQFMGSLDISIPEVLRQDSDSSPSCISQFICGIYFIKDWLRGRVDNTS